MKKFILLFATLSAAFLSTLAQKVSAFEHLDIGVTLRAISRESRILFRAGI